MNCPRIVGRARRALLIVAAISSLGVPFIRAEATSTGFTPLAWGGNSFNQLGYANPASDLRPDLVVGLGAGSGVITVAAGGGHSVALKADGTVLTWGNNSDGQLGDGTLTPRLTPIQVSGLGAGSGVIAIAAGTFHNLALMSDGTVLAWGANASGQLGDGTTIGERTPVQVFGLGPGSGVIAIATGGLGTAGHSLAVKSDGTVLAWGVNSSGQLGDGTTIGKMTPVQVSGLGPGSDVVSVAAGVGGNHSLALKSDGAVLAWGLNNSGQLGDGTLSTRLTPVQVTGLTSGSGAVAIAAGGGHNLALRSDGTVLAWGANASGQLGDGTTIPKPAPVQVSGLGSGSGVIAITVGSAHSLALKSDGTVLSWGNNATGQLGDGTTTQKTTPVAVTDSLGGALGGVAAIAAGTINAHSLALSIDGTVLAWGSNVSGQLGDGSIYARLEPLQVATLDGIVAVGAGAVHNMALKADGTVLAWGSNSVGQLGDGTLTRTMTPVQVSGLEAGSGVIAIAPGADYSLALMSDGTVLAWGVNSAGQLGDATTISKTTPVQVSGLGPGSGVIAIAAGGHSLALKSDGTVLAWGPNVSGQLGDGTTILKTTPVQVSGLGPGSGVVAIGAALQHSMALNADGTVLAWGSNASGQLGDGTLTPRPTPVQVNGLGDGSGVIAIAPRGSFSLALESDGTVLAWGANASGQLGDGTTIPKPTPVQVSGLGSGSGVIAIAAGGSHSLAVKSDGTLWAWGSNSSGQLGVGTFVNAITPVQVHNPPGTGFLTGVAAVVAGADYSLVLEDTTPPVLTTPTSVVVEATGPSGATVTFAASASDSDDMAGPLTCSPTSGSVFPIGTTTVTCSSTDTHANTGHTNFDVTVRDTTPPTLALPADIHTPATSTAGTIVNYSATATDLVDGAITARCTPAPGSKFPISTTIVRCTVTDEHDNSSEGTFTVVVGCCDLGLTVSPSVTTRGHAVTITAFASNYSSKWQTGTISFDLTTPCTHERLGSFPVILLPGKKVSVSVPYRISKASCLGAYTFTTTDTFSDGSMTHHSVTLTVQ